MRIHRRHHFELTKHLGIPITTPAQTIADMAPRVTDPRLERMIDDADKLDLVHPDELMRFAVEHGVRPLRELLARQSFVLTDSELERFFVPLALEAGLPVPQSRVWVTGYKVDFWWPDLALVVECDSNRFHRTGAAQTRDRLRDQAHFAAGVRTLRFTHHQIAYDPGHVVGVLRYAL
ncbi:MAG: DUF559 domain-containing protein [Thermoleophilaceae bacterium]|nr:DUF559 domain-containing protein [Thermoleophilaceae bacterium]